MSAQTYRDRLAQYFTEHPGKWIRAIVFEDVAGRQAWRTRISECRRQLGMDIENRTRVLILHDPQCASRPARNIPCDCNCVPSRIKISEYRYVPPVERQGEPTADVNAWSLR